MDVDRHVLAAGLANNVHCLRQSINGDIVENDSLAILKANRREFWVGLALDLCGDNSSLGWGIGFGHLAVVTLIGFIVLRRLRAG